MGVRVHKIMGYGLTDVKTREYRIADGRINRNSKLFNGYDLEIGDYISYLESKFDKSNFDTYSLDLSILSSKDTKENNRKYSMREGLFWNGEYGMKNVLVLKPICCDDWYRYDDSIDYVEETYKWSSDKDAQSNHVRVLKYGLYPWSGTFMNAKEGERVREGIDFIHAKRPNLRPFYNVDELAQKLGFENEADADLNLVPLVPYEIRSLAEYGNLFTNDEVWRQLRPMIYTYWS